MMFHYPPSHNSWQPTFGLNVVYTHIYTFSCHYIQHEVQKGRTTSTKLQSSIMTIQYTSSYLLICNTIYSLCAFIISFTSISHVWYNWKCGMLWIGHKICYIFIRRLIFLPFNANVLFLYYLLFQISEMILEQCQRIRMFLPAMKQS